MLADTLTRRVKICKNDPNELSCLLVDHLFIALSTLALMHLFACFCIYMHMLEPFEESEEKWLSSLESSRWMEYVRYDWETLSSHDTAYLSSQLVPEVILCQRCRKQAYVFCLCILRCLFRSQQICFQMVMTVYTSKIGVVLVFLQDISAACSRRSLYAGKQTRVCHTPW